MKENASAVRYIFPIPTCSVRVGLERERKKKMKIDCKGGRGLKVPILFHGFDDPVRKVWRVEGRHKEHEGEMSLHDLTSAHTTLDFNMRLDDFLKEVIQKCRWR